MGSSKQISVREALQIVILLQQGGLFWMLPVLLTHRNGTAGLFALLPGLIAGCMILLAGLFWHKHHEELSFVKSSQAVFGKPAGMVFSLSLTFLYLLFAVFCLNSFVEVIHTQLMPETPRIILLIPVFILTGWLAWNGIEDLARLTSFAIVSMVFLLILAALGSIGGFSVENLLPLQTGGPYISGSYYSIFSYSSFLIILMVYPALNHTNGLAWKMPLIVVLTTIVFLVCAVLAIGVFGQFSMEQIVWFPLELARMIQISSFLERTEALVAAFWLPAVLVNGALFLWGVSENIHQMMKKKKSRWLHWAFVMGAVIFSAVIDNLAELFYLEQVLAPIITGGLACILLLLLAGSLLYNRREEKTG